MTDEKMRLALLVYIRKTYGSQSKAAEAWEVSPQHISNMITGRKRLTDEVLLEMGYERDTRQLVTYRKIKASEC